MQISSFDSKILLLVQYKSSCIRSCLHHSDWRIIFQMLVCSPTKTICEYEYEQYSNLKHTIGSNDAQILISNEKTWNFLHVRLQRYFGQMFAVPTSLFMSVSPPCPIYVHFTPNAVRVRIAHRRFRYYQILNNVLQTIKMHNKLSFPRQRDDFFASPIAQIKLMFPH